MEFIFLLTLKNFTPGLTIKYYISLTAAGFKSSIYINQVLQQIIISNFSELQIQTLVYYILGLLLTRRYFLDGPHILTVLSSETEASISW
jgi:hypothetical protein